MDLVFLPHPTSPLVIISGVYFEYLRLRTAPALGHGPVVVFKGVCEQPDEKVNKRSLSMDSLATEAARMSARNSARRAAELVKAADVAPCYYRRTFILANKDLNL